MYFWQTLFHLKDHHAAHAAPPPCERVEIAESHGERRGAVEDVPHAVADLLTHAVTFVAMGVPHIKPRDEEHYGDCRVWRYMLELPTGSARACGRPYVDGKAGPQSEVEARAVTVEGSFEFATAMDHAVRDLRAIPGVVAHLVGQHADLDAALARAKTAEESLQALDDSNGD